jgi:hypothetical protein
MRPFASAAALLASLLLAVPAFAFDTRTHYERSRPERTAGLMQCDSGVDLGAFFQADTHRYGNTFTFGPGISQLTTVEITHHGYYLMPGPYAFDVELWDNETCTFMSSVDGLVASDAFDRVVTESFNVCPGNLIGSGRINVMIDPNSCDTPFDCYPDLEFDQLIPGSCQRIINAVTSKCQTGLQGGNFLLRISLDDCATPTVTHTWGAVKTRYR